MQGLHDVPGVAEALHPRRAWRHSWDHQPDDPWWALVEEALDDVRRDMSLDDVVTDEGGVAAERVSGHARLLANGAVRGAVDVGDVGDGEPILLQVTHPLRAASSRRRLVHANSGHCDALGQGGLLVCRS